MTTLRTAQRERLAALLTAAGNWQAVYDHQPGDFSGQTPVATVHGGGVGTGQDVFGSDLGRTVRLLVTNFVKRRDGAASEGNLDELLVAVLDLIKTNYKDAGNWLALEVEGASEPDYYLINGEQYRGETITVAALVWE